MNPKDMTNYDLVSKGLWATFSNGVNDGRGRKRSAEHTELTDVLDVELLRRLNERDQYKSQWENCNSDYHFSVEQANALRKENEELRNLLGECPKRNNRLGTYSDAKPVQIDVCKLICMTKESEASHA